MDGLSELKLSGMVAWFRYTWNLSKADASGQTPLHLAAQLLDDGCMAGLILRHPACSTAGSLWSTLKDANGQTPADVASRCRLFSSWFEQLSSLLQMTEDREEYDKALHLYQNGLRCCTV